MGLGENAFSKKDLVAMWQRPLERQYSIAFAKIIEAIKATNGDINIAFSGGKDSTLLLDMYCDAVCYLGMQDKPVKVRFADTTNETKTIYEHIPKFLIIVQTNITFILIFKRHVQRLLGLDFA